MFATFVTFVMGARNRNWKWKWKRKRYYVPNVDVSLHWNLFMKCLTKLKKTFWFLNTQNFFQNLYLKILKIRNLGVELFLNVEFIDQIKNKMICSTNIDW